MDETGKLTRERYDKFIDREIDELAKDLEAYKVVLKELYDKLNLATFRTAKITTDIHVEGVA